MLRYYDRLGVVHPSHRTASGYREYTEQDVWRLLRAEALRSLGLSLQEVRQALDADGAAPARPDTMLGALITRTREQLEHQRELLTRLERLAAAGPESWEEALDTIQLIRRLESARPATRYRAALDAAQGADKPVAPLVRALLAEDETNIAGALRWALAQAERSAAPGGVPEALAPALTHPDPVVRERAVRALGDLDPAGADPLLLGALEDDDAGVRGLAALILGARGAGAERTVPALIELVIDGDHDVEAAEALGRFARTAPLGASGAAPGEAAPRAGRITRALAARLDDDGTPAEARRRIVQALAELPRASTERLLERLAVDDDRDVARIAAYVRSLDD